MLKKCSYLALLVGVIAMPCTANAVVIDTFSAPAFTSYVSATGSTYVASSVMAATGEAIGDFRQGAIQSFAGTTSATLQDSPNELAIAFSGAGARFYSIYNGSSDGSSLSGLSGLGGANLAAGGETGILLRNLAVNAVDTVIGITLFNAAGTASRAIYYTVTAASPGGADYFFSFQNWAAGAVSVSSVGGIILSIAAPSGGNNDVFFLSSASPSIETVVTPPSGAIIITPEPASLVMWSGLLFFGCAFFGLRRRSVPQPDVALAI